MIHSAIPTVSSVAIIVFSLEICFVLKSGDGRTDNMCKNNDNYRPLLWVGHVDQFKTGKTLFTNYNIKGGIQNKFKASAEAQNTMTFREILSH